MEKKIDLMIVGAQKAGTTSLLRYLSEHPQCVGHPQKEFAYFVDISEYGNRYDLAFKKYFSESSNVENHKLIAKSAGLYTDETAIKRLFEHNPKCEIVLILRNPVDRTYSSYLMEKNYGSLKFDFSELPELIQKNKKNWRYDFLITYSLYSMHLSTLLKYFPLNQITILLYDDLLKKPEQICIRIYKKLGIDSSFIPNTSIKHNVTLKNRSKLFAKATKHIIKKNGLTRRMIEFIVPKRKIYKLGEILRGMNKSEEKHSKMDEEAKKFLLDLYKPYNEELEKMVKIDLSNWNR